MPKFNYTARTSGGGRVEGLMEASSSEAVAGQLLQSGAIPLQIELYEARPPGLLQTLRRRLGWDAPGIDDLILFSRQCYTLTRAGVPIIRGFRLLAESYRNPVFAETINEVAADLEAGRDLSTAMGRHPKIFSPLFVNMIRVGETSGKLDEAFLHLHDYYERDKETLRQIKTALRYPTFVLVALVIAVAILMIFVIPKFASFYAKNGLTLPLPTRIIMGISNFMVDYWYLLFGLVGLGIFGFTRYINTDKGRLWWDERKVKFWIFGNIVMRGTLGRFARTLAMALKAGVPILQSVTVTARAVGNEYLSVKILRMRESVERGESLLRAAGKQQVFTSLVLQMVAVGEESGRLDEMLDEIAGFYEREVDYDVKHMNAIIEPLLTVAMAGLVLLLMLGIFLPMWNVVEMLK
ncbi:MAG TPA: type II secretion system F family protein [Gammaproteobacteria bacterium]